MERWLHQEGITYETAKDCRNCRNKWCNGLDSFPAGNRFCDRICGNALRERNFSRNELHRTRWAVGCCWLCGGTHRIWWSGGCLPSVCSCGNGNSQGSVSGKADSLYSHFPPNLALWLWEAAHCFQQRSCCRLALFVHRKLVFYRGDSNDAVLCSSCVWFFSSGICTGVRHSRLPTGSRSRSGNVLVCNAALFYSRNGCEVSRRVSPLWV